jgi:ParB family chromosome partitioning protein
MAATKKGAGKAAGAKTTRPRKKKLQAEAGSRGLPPAELAGEAPPAAISALSRAIVDDGGAVLGAYRDPVGGHWQILAGLPAEKVIPTPFQRDLSETHVARLADVIHRLDRFLDPVIAVRTKDGTYWTPNGHHRASAVKRLGGRSIVALVLPDEEVAYRILALNTEKAHNLREKSLEVIRMARALAAADGRTEKEFVLEFEEAPFLTLGLCYEERGRFSGGAYHPVLKRIDEFLDKPLPKALEVRKERAARLLELDDAVVAAVQALKKRGFDSPYLKAFVVARVNPIRFQRAATAPFDATVEKMLASASGFDAASIRPDQLARASGPPEE